MNAAQYRRIFAWFEARPAAKRMLHLAARGSVAAVYLLYAALLVGLALGRSTALWPALGVPALVFLSGTALRAGINRPRPYETLGFRPLFPKDTVGKSMPSRHCFSAAAIAVTAWMSVPALGAVLGILAVIIALSRVLEGVHYPSDVAAGLGYGAALACLGFWIWNLIR